MEDRLFELARNTAPEAETSTRLASYLTLLRSSQHKTLRQVAEEAQGVGDAVSVSLLADAEKGRVVPSAAKLLMLAKIYRIPAQRFLDLIELDTHRVDEAEQESLEATEKKAQDAFELGDYVQAHNYLERAVAMPSEKEHQILLRNRKAVCLWKMGKLHWARDEFESVLGIFELEPSLKMQAFGNLSAVFRQMANFEMARAMSLQALDLARGLGSDDRTGIVLNNVANLDFEYYERRGRKDAFLLDRAVKGYGESLTCFKENEENRELAAHRVVALMNLGNCQVLQGQPAKGFRSLREAFKASEGIHHHRYTTLVLSSLGKGHYEVQDYDPSKGYFHKSEMMAVQHGYNDIRFSNHYYLWLMARRERNQVSERGAFKTLNYLIKHCEADSIEVSRFLEHLENHHKENGDE